MQIWAVTEAKKPLQRLEVPDPRPMGTEVVLRVSHCALCHSDLHFWEGEYNLGGGKIMKLAERGVELPRAISHEMVGTVIEVGPEAEGVQVGDKRIVFPWIGCGTCERCQVGEDNLCVSTRPIGVATHGGLAEKVLVPHPRYLVDYGDLDPGVAATYACSGITVYGALRKLDLRDPDRAVVLCGAGGLGLSSIAMLKALDHRNIVVIDTATSKRDAVLAAGASAFVDGKSPTLVDDIKAAAGGPVLNAVDFVNADATARTLFDSLAKGGQLVLVGVAGGELTLSLAGMVFVPRSVMGTVTGTVQDLRDVVALAQSGKLKPIPTEHLPIAEANTALDRLHRGRVMGRVVLVHEHLE